MGVAEARATAVAETIAAVRKIEADRGVTRAALEAIRAELIKLGDQTDLFPHAEYTPPESGRDSQLYLLSEDDDHRFTLYLNCGTDEKNTPPHNHKTWAVVVGVRGDEHNRIYRRVGEDTAAGKAELRVAREITVRPGTGVCLMPEDIHSIHMSGADVKMHLHLYGTAIPHQSERQKFDLEAGTYEHFEPHPSIR